MDSGINDRTSSNSDNEPAPWLVSNSELSDNGYVSYLTAENKFKRCATFRDMGDRPANMRNTA